MCVTLRKTKLLTRLLAPMSHCTLTDMTHKTVQHCYFALFDCVSCTALGARRYKGTRFTLIHKLEVLYSWCQPHYSLPIHLKEYIAFSILLAIRLIVLRPCFICTLHLCFTRLEKRGTVEKAQRHFPLQSNRFSDKLTV